MSTVVRKTALVYLVPCKDVYGIEMMIRFHIVRTEPHGLGNRLLQSEILVKRFMDFFCKVFFYVVDVLIGLSGYYSPVIRTLFLIMTSVCIYEQF